MADLISTQIITSKIFLIRGKKVMLDSDLALLYEIQKGIKSAFQKILCFN
jgi:hypothetical protein